MTTISRREFLKQAMALGLSASSAAALLEACGGTQSAGGKVTVNLYHTIPTATETFWKQTLLPSFEKQYPNMNLITYQLGVENPQVIRTKIKPGATPRQIWPGLIAGRPEHTSRRTCCPMWMAGSTHTPLSSRISSLRSSRSRRTRERYGVSPG